MRETIQTFRSMIPKSTSGFYDKAKQPSYKRAKKNGRNYKLNILKLLQIRRQRVKFAVQRPIQRPALILKYACCATALFTKNAQWFV